MVGNDMTTIDEIAVVFDGPHATPKKTDSGPYFLSISSLENGKLDLSKSAHLSEEQFIKWTKRVTPEEGDILFSYETRLGEAALMPPNVKGCLGRRMGLLRPDQNKVLPAYLLYAYLSHDFQSTIEQRKNHGCTVDRIALKELPSFPIRIPPLPEQKSAVHILKSLDNKIELNRQMNATLEGMAQGLFKSWFVDFDPVIDNALAAGNPIPEAFAARAETRRKALADGAANRDVAKQFPEAFQFTEEMEWIPEGWEVVPLGNLLRSVSDTYPLKAADKVIFLNTGDILDGSFLHQNLSETDGLPGQAKKSIREKDILYSEIRPQNKRFAYVHFDGSNYVVSTKLMVLRATGDVSSIFTYLVLKQDATINNLQIMAESRSGTFPQITFDVLSKIEIALPQKTGIVNTFSENFLEPTFQKQLKNNSVSENLSNLRDTLLPKLISGEIRIPEAEKLTKETLA